MNELTLSLLGTVLSLVFAIGGAFLIPPAKKWLDAKVGVEKSNLVFDWAATFVRAAEKTITAGGGAKYLWVAEALRGLTDSHNIKIDDVTLEAAIEAAVLELQQGAKPSAVGNVVVTAPVDAPVIVEKKEGV